jgi:hypothetical protein
LSLSSTVRGEKYTPDNCDFGDVSLCSSIGMECSLFEAYCEGDIGEITVIDEGTPGFAEAKKNCENYTDACGDAEATQPPDAECTGAVTVRFTETVTHNSTGGIEGGTFLAGIKAKFEFEIGGSNGVEVEVTETIGASPLPSCEWAVYALRVRTVVGKVLSIDATVTPTRICDCGGTKATASGAPQTVVATVEASVAFEEESWTETISNGSCPPNPPSPPF